MDRAEGAATVEFGRHDWHFQGECLVNVMTATRSDKADRQPEAKMSCWAPTDPLPSILCAMCVCTLSPPTAHQMLWAQQSLSTEDNKKQSVLILLKSMFLYQQWIK